VRTYTKSATSLQSDCCPLVAFLVSVGLDDGFETVPIQVALQRLVGALKVETARDEGVEINLAAGHHVDACRPGVGVRSPRAAA
jgi:hypothetical protein